MVDVVDTEIKIKDDKIFFGLYNMGFPKRPWASENRLLLSTIQKYVVVSYLIDIGRALQCNPILFIRFSFCYQSTFHLHKNYLELYNKYKYFSMLTTSLP